MKYKIILILIASLFVGSIASANWLTDLLTPNNQTLGGTTLTVPRGGTGATSFNSGECLVGNGTGAITTQACGGVSTGGYPDQLGQVGDVSTSTLAWGHVLYFDGTNWQDTSTSSLGITGSGTVTSVDMSVPTGFTIANNPITTSGILALDFAGGYQLYTTYASTTLETIRDTYVATETDPVWTGVSGDYLLIANAFTQAIASTTFQPIIPANTYDPYGQATSSINYLIANNYFDPYGQATSSINSLTATYPIINTSGDFSLAFGTTTANSWSQLQTFNGNIKTDQITSVTDADAVIQLGPEENAFHFHPGGSAGNYFITMYSESDDINNPQFYPSVNNAGQLGTATNMWGFVRANMLIGNNASTTLFSSVYASSTSLYAGYSYLTNLANPAGSFLAVNGNGQIIATTTPMSGVSSVTGTYPIISSGGATPAISLAFGTTTPNAWSGLQEFTNASSTQLTVTGNTWLTDNLYVQKTWGTGATLPTTIFAPAGDESIMFFNPRTGAFWAGEFNATSTLVSQVGAASARFGLDNNAIGYASMAVGYNNLATGDQSFVIGTNSIAGGTNSFAGGNGCKAFGLDSFCFGLNGLASGSYSISIGNAGLATSTGSAVFGGNGNKVGLPTSVYGVVVGGATNENYTSYGTIIGGDLNVISSGSDYSSIIGGEANLIKSSSDFSVIIGGGGNQISNSNSVGIGRYLSITAYDAFAIGEGLNASTPLLNNQNQSIYLGINSTIPTLAITKASGAGTLGNVGIGTTTPNYLLTVNGTASSTIQYANTLYIPTLATPAGSFLAVDGSGQIIATSTPTGTGEETDPIWTAASGDYLLTAGFGTPFYQYLSATNTDALAQGSNNLYFSGFTSLAVDYGFTDNSTNWDTAYTNRVDTWTYPLAFAGNAASLSDMGTSTITCTGSVSCGAGSYVIGSALTITGSASGGGIGTISTSTSPTIGGLAYWTSKDAWPETLGSVATTSLTASTPLSLSQVISVIGGSASALSIADAVADGSTKGAASFTANDFNDSSGNISIDYANGQIATAGQNGFLSSGLLTVFNNKVSTSSINTIAKINTNLLSGESVASTTWSGATSLITLGTVTTGTWSAMSIATNKGGTGLTDGGLMTGYIPFGAGTSPFATSTALYFDNAGSLLTVTNIISTSATTTNMVVGADGAAQPGCLAVQDVDSGGWTYCYTLDGSMTCNTSDCSGAATSTLIIGR